MIIWWEYGTYLFFIIGSFQRPTENIFWWLLLYYHIHNEKKKGIIKNIRYLNNKIMQNISLSTSSVKKTFIIIPKYLPTNTIFYNTTIGLLWVGRMRGGGVRRRIYWTTLWWRLSVLNYPHLNLVELHFNLEIDLYMI